MTHPKEIRAVGDGKADDTTAIERVLRAGGEAILPRGTYRLTRPVVVPLDRMQSPLSIRAEAGARLLMSGAGPALKIVGTHAGTADPTSVKRGVWERERMPLLDGLEIAGDHPDADGIELQGTMQATLTRLLIRECRDGIRLSGRNRNVLIAACHVYHNHGRGIFLDRVNLHQININGCHVSYNARGGIVVLGSEVRNLQIVGNDIEYNFDPNATESADVWLETGDQSIREGSITGNTIQALRSPGGANIRIIGQSKEVAHKAGLLSICGNLISHQEMNIYLRWVRGVTIGGNTFQTAYTRAVVAEESSHVAIDSNVFDHNPDYSRDFVNGIRLQGCRSCLLTSFQVDRCTAGTPERGGAVELFGCEDITVRDLQILNPRHRGMDLRDCRWCSIQGCDILADGGAHAMRAGISIEGGRDNWIAGNRVRGATHGGVELGAGSGAAEGNRCG